MSESPGIGHNRPSIEVVLASETEDLVKKAAVLFALVDKIPARIDDEVTNKEMADLGRRLALCRSEAEKARKASKEPSISEGKLIEAHYSLIIDPLDKAKTVVGSRVTDYEQRKLAAERLALQEEAKRRKEEAELLAWEAAGKAKAADADDADDADARRPDLEAVKAADAARKHAEAEAAAAQRAAEAPAAELTRTRGEVGMSSLATVWAFKDLDIDKLDLGALRHLIDVAAIEKAIRLFVRNGGRELDGCTIFQDTRARFRG